MLAGEELRVVNSVVLDTTSPSASEIWMRAQRLLPFSCFPVWRWLGCRDCVCERTDDQSNRANRLKLSRPRDAPGGADQRKASSALRFLGLGRGARFVSCRSSPGPRLVGQAYPSTRPKSCYSSTSYYSCGGDLARQIQRARNGLSDSQRWILT